MELQTPSSKYESNYDMDMEELNQWNWALNPKGNTIETLWHQNILTPLTPILHRQGRHVPTLEPDKPCMDMQLVDKLNGRPAVRVLTEVEDALQDVNQRHLFGGMEGFHEAFQWLIAATRWTLDETEGIEDIPELVWFIPPDSQ